MDNILLVSQAQPDTELERVRQLEQDKFQEALGQVNILAESVLEQICTREAQAVNIQAVAQARLNILVVQERDSTREVQVVWVLEPVSVLDNIPVEQANTLQEEPVFIPSVATYPGVVGGFGVSGTAIDQYPGGQGTGGGGGLPPQTIQLPEEEDDSFSQAESSVKDGEVMASAQGRKNGGTAQTQVSGTYTGTGSFSASAQTSDSDRAAQAQVSGGKEGAVSTAQGTGGVGKSQSAVQVDSKTGGTSATSQSGGLGHESQSEVVANEKGGLADAQSSGPGQTSSQAQIGFRPQGEAVANQANIFNGGGQASAQSGAHSGQSQSQISGNFKFGIAYHGAAQAASGTKEQVHNYREKSKNLFHSIGLFGKTTGTTVRKESIDVNGMTTRQQYSAAPLPPVTFVNTTPDTITDDDYADMDEDEDDYDEDYDSTAAVRSGGTPTDESKPPTTVTHIVTEPTTVTVRTNGNGRVFTQAGPTQRQTAIVPHGENFRLVQTQNGRSTVHAVTTERTGGLPTIGTTTARYSTRFLPSKQDTPADIVEGAPTEPSGGPRKAEQPDSYISVTKQVTGIDENSKVPAIPGKNYESTYYTKSSTCGYFTFSCNIVYGENGRSKICRPKPPANGKC
uniref:Uncharacterized protein n=1 Tax=Anopheles albimanus TaxID=7167 RepID=A0A182FDD1_ANOAL